MKKQKQRERTQFSFEIDNTLAAEIDAITSQSLGLTKADIGRAALREKVREIRQRLEAGEEVAVSV